MTLPICTRSPAVSLRRPLSARRAAIALAFFAGAGMAGCKAEQPKAAAVWTTAGEAPLSAGDPRTGPGMAAMDATLDGLVKLAAVKLPAAAKAGGRVPVTVVWQVVGDPLPAKTRVFVHGHAEGAELNQVSADHDVLRRVHPTTEWLAGDLVVDTFHVNVPRGYVGDTLRLYAGLYAGDHRFEAQPRAAHDGKNRVVLGDVQITGGRGGSPHADVRPASGPIKTDGVLDEPDWKSAARLGPFIAYDGRRRIKQTTYARLLWTPSTLYVAFEAKDGDAHSPYTKRDDPLYESEAVEIFIDADGDKDEYVELQAAPTGVQFDAAFKGGRRKNFDTGYHATYTVGTVVNGTVNDPSDTDQGWVSEWAIDVASLRDAPAQIAAGMTWHINMFRLERLRRAGKVVGAEASAWSSPLSGDFHNLNRFGTITFVAAEKPAAPASQDAPAAPQDAQAKHPPTAK